MPFVIEAASHDDVPAMSALLDDLFSIEQDFQPNGENQMRAMHRLLDLPDLACLMVARDESGKIAGMVSGQLVISTAQGSPSMWVEDMVVRSDCRAQGLGRRLLEALLTWAISKGATRAQLLVDIDNTPAVGYYEHLGWQSTRLAARRIMLSR